VKHSNILYRVAIASDTLSTGGDIMGHLAAYISRDCFPQCRNKKKKYLQTKYVGECMAVRKSCNRRLLKMT
jgi:hypothetical protein